jgi:hypothetical protein
VLLGVAGKSIKIWTDLVFELLHSVAFISQNLGDMVL